MSVIASYSIKGGVGKTATAVNLAYLCAKQGYRTLIWDLDPQGAASFYFRVKAKVKGGSKSILWGKQSLASQIKGTDYENLDLLPADFSYRKWDIQLGKLKRPTERLQKHINSIANDYDMIFLDCPPGITLLSENIFNSANILLVPVIPTSLSVHTLEQLYAFKQRHQLDLTILPFFSMVDRRKKMHQDIVQSLPEQYSVLTSEIPYASDVEAMGIKRAVVDLFAPKKTAAKAYNELWAELKAQLTRSQC